MCVCVGLSLCLSFKLCLSLCLCVCVSVCECVCKTVDNTLALLMFAIQSVLETMFITKRLFWPTQGSGFRVLTMVPEKEVPVSGFYKENLPDFRDPYPSFIPPPTKSCQRQRKSAF